MIRVFSLRLSLCILMFCIVFFLSMLVSFRFKSRNEPSLHFSSLCFGTNTVTKSILLRLLRSVLLGSSRLLLSFSLEPCSLATSMNLLIVLQQIVCTSQLHVRQFHLLLRPLRITLPTRPDLFLEDLIYIALQFLQLRLELLDRLHFTQMPHSTLLLITRVLICWFAATARRTRSFIIMRRSSSTNVTARPACPARAVRPTR